MYCKTKSLFRSGTSEVVDPKDIRSPIFDFADLEDEGQDPPNRKKSKKHKKKSKHKRRRRKEKRKEKQLQEKNQEQGQKEKLPEVKPQTLEEKKNAKLEPINGYRPAVPYVVPCDSIQK